MASDGRDLMEESSWSSPTDHFKIRHKFLTLFYDHDFLVQDWLNAKSSWLGKSYLPAWTPLYFAMTWFSARNRNLFLVENHLTYRPFAQRKNEKLKY
jgi:hypothetical protein